MTDTAPEPASTALVIGGRGGVGAALLQLWQTEGRYRQLLATSRDPGFARPGVACLPLDLRDEHSLDAFATQLQSALNDEHLHTVCVCSGILHAAGLQPERRFAELSAAAFAEVMQINALGPLLLAQRLIPILPRKRRSRLLFMSARVGSIADNRLGGWVSYRASKAALNQGVQTLAIELSRTHPGCVVSLYHPGTVDTPLSQPFSGRVPAQQLFSAEEAAAKLSAVLHQRDDPQAHLFVDWAGKPVSF